MTKQKIISDTASRKFFSAMIGKYQSARHTEVIFPLRIYINYKNSTECNSFHYQGPRIDAPWALGASETPKSFCVLCNMKSGCMDSTDELSIDLESNY